MPKTVTETLAQITAPHMCVGIVLWDDKVVEASGTVKYMRKWTRDRVREYCKKKGWRIVVVWQMERTV